MISAYDNSKEDSLQSSKKVVRFLKRYLEASSYIQVEILNNISCPQMFRLDQTKCQQKTDDEDSGILVCSYLYQLLEYNKIIFYRASSNFRSLLSKTLTSLNIYSIDPPKLKKAVKLQNHIMKRRANPNRHSHINKQKAKLAVAPLTIDLSNIGKRRMRTMSIMDSLMANMTHLKI